MHLIQSREELYKKYKQSQDTQWEDFIWGLSKPRHAIEETLYHLSFNKVPSGIWSPKPPKPGEASSEAHPIFGEMLPNRISTSPTIAGCWAGVFPYIAKTLLDDKTQTCEVVGYLYEAKPKRGTRVLTPDTLFEYYLVQDAHLTNEYCLLGDTQMTLIAEITFKNTAVPPLSNWVSGYAFDDKKYGKIQYAPMVVLNNKPITPETDMSVIKLNISNEHMQNRLSLEAATNPLGILSEGLVTKFSVLVTQLNNLNAVFAHTGNPNFEYQLKPRKVRGITDANNYMQLMNYGVGVPDGFIGPLVPYMGLLIETLNLYKNIRTEVTAPVARELGAILANPSKLRNSTVGTLSKLNFNEAHNKAFKDKVKSYYNPKSQRDEISYSRLFNDNSEFIKAAELVVVLEDVLNKVNKEVSGVLDDVNRISGLADKLAIRVMQDKQTYGINANIANELSTAIAKTAEAVSFLSALIVLGEEAIGIVDNLIKKIK